MEDGLVLRHVRREALQELVDRGEAVAVPRGEQPPRPRSVHLVVSGRVALHDGARQLGTFEVGDVIDPRRQPNGTRRRALAATRLIAVAPRAWDEFLRANPAAATAAAELDRLRLARRSLLDVLDEAFPGLSEQTAQRLADLAEVVRIPAGDVLCREGDAARTAYLVIRGRLRATRAHADGPVVLGELGKGAVAGERSLLDAGIRNATLRAVRDADVAILHRNALELLLSDGPDTVGAILLQVMRRAEQPANSLDADDHLLAFVPTADPELALAAARRVLDELPPDRTGVVVGPRDAHAQLGNGHAPRVDAEADATLHRWLDRLEDENDLVLFVTDPEWSSWTRRCARQADRLVLVADATAPPALTPVEKAMAYETPRSIHARRSLVLVQPDDIALPTGTAAWLRERDVDAHYHLRLGVREDGARLARLLTGRPVGLVLGGGGARGFAELGAYRAMHDRGLPVDLVTGTSIGAVLGAAIAQTLDPRVATEIAATGFRDVRQLTLPLAAMLHGGEVWAQLSNHFRGIDIEDLWLPFACMSTDMTAGRAVAHRRGPVAEAVRASIALPGLLTPIDLDGHLHVDGGILDNLPVEALRVLEPRAHVVAVDVAPPRGPRAAQPLPRAVSGWGLLARRIVPGIRPPAIPSLPRTILQSTMVGAARKRRELLDAGLIDCHVPLDVGAHALTAFHLTEQIAEVGHAGAGPVLD